MSEDLLKQAKALRSSAFGTHKQALDVVDELIAEVEDLRSKLDIAVDFANNLVALWIQMAGAETVLQGHRMRILELGQELIENQSTKIAAKDARIKELEEMIRQLGSLAFMGDMPLDQIVAHFIAWGQSNYDYTSRLEAAFLKAEKANLMHHMDADYADENAREALERIRNGE